MKYPNTRYAHPNELLFYMRGMSVKTLAKTLKRSEKTIKNYLDGKQKIPFWIPELLRLKEMEFWQQHYKHDVAMKLGRVKGEVIQMAKRPTEAIKAVAQPDRRAAGMALMQRRNRMVG